MRRSTLALVLITVAVGVGLFLVKYRVQGLEAQLQDLNRDIADDREAIHVLKAEWSHLNEPDRLKRLVGRPLGMIPVGVEQVTTRTRMDSRLPQVSASAENDIAAESGVIAGKEFRP